MGNAVVTCELYPPLDVDVAVPGFVGTITDEGVAGAVLTVALNVLNPIPAINIKATNRE
jgi:hypothetical protein